MVRSFHKKTVILLVAVITVFLLSSFAAQGKYHFTIMEKVVATVLAPVEYVFSKVGYSLQQAGMFSGQLITVYRDNQLLKAENERLRQNEEAATEVLAENTRLRTMLDYKKGAPQFDFVLASIIARDPGSWTSTIIINRGSADGIAKDMPVVTPQGLVGNIVSVTGSTAKVQLILDPRSAVGALVQRTESRVAAIVEGAPANPLTPRMVNIARDADIIKGDKIITSGFGGIYPKGLSIGEVLDVINEDGGLLKYAVLKPSVDFDRIEEVFVLVHSREPVPQLPAPATTPTPQTGQTANPQGVTR
ncbi:rod shape-determining protein MreC [Propionispora vibrioides]|uniref:Cell shape-determining protein MreC n=1 Tax=Propionispora vibrioides TaxID=112903 RepID=A0A1H8NC55_9FIRM|nr:rod shape-determining protein MreC [Propionispora vibrioides]SEO27136.1 rod shape-determining protein MreC [Propionispora vibrioides]